MGGKRLRRSDATIEAFLKSRYPDHVNLTEGLSALAEAGLEKLSELDGVKYGKLSRMLSPLLCLALRDYVTSDSADPVETSCLMTLECTERYVELRPENKFNPMIFCEQANLVLQDGPSHEMRMFEQAIRDLPDPPQQQGPLKLKLYDFSCSVSAQRTVQSIWGKCRCSGILERPCYREVREKLMELWDVGSSGLLLGMPGMGKTGFIITTVVHLMKKRKAILLQTKGGERFLFEPQGSASSGDVIGEGYRCYVLNGGILLQDPEVYFLVDGKLPDVPCFDGKALLAATPLLSNYKDYAKDGRVERLYLPVWSADEVAIAWQEFFDPSLPRNQQFFAARPQGSRRFQARRQLTLEVVKERYRKWGGMARLVLEMPDVDLDVGVESL